MKLMSRILLLAFVAVALGACPFGCLFCNFNGVCTQCSNGFQMTDNSFCAAMLPLQGCQLYSTGGRCKECISGYTLQNGLCNLPPPLCLRSGPGNICVRCQANYTLIDGRCWLANRVNCTGAFEGFHMGICYKIPVTNCLKLFINGSCQNCTPGYQRINEFCFKVRIAPGGACNQSNLLGECSACNPPYVLSRFLCWNITVENCDINQGIVCTKCSPGFILDNGICIEPPRPTDRNCKSIDLSNGNCIQCVFLFQLNADGRCTRINTYCSTSDSNGDCTSCLQTMRLMRGVCIYGDQNCKIVDYDNLQCLSCNNGYTLSNNKSICEKVEECSNRTNRICVSCAPDYVLVDGVCFAKLPNCLTLSSSGLCAQCSVSTTLKDGNCIFYSDNCLIYDQNSGLCADCAPNFYLRDKVCSKFIEGCVRVDQSFRCIRCREGLLVSDGACIERQESCERYNNNGCEICAKGFFLLSGRCKPYPAFCLIVDSQGNCSFCLNRTILLNGRCVRYQTFCLDYDDNGVCNAVPRDFRLERSTVVNPFASDWNFLGNIANCKQGFIRANDSCVRPVENCIQYDPLGACKICQPGFSLNTPSCVPLNITCQALSINGLSCIVCKRQFKNIRGNCYNQSNFVLPLDSSNRATYRIGYDFSPQLLVALPLNFNCLTQNFTSNICTKCATYYTLINGSCVIFDSNCVRYNIRGICQNCTAGFRFTNGLCRSLRFCSGVSDPLGQCTECQKGYIMMSGICVPQISENCAIYDTNMACQACVANNVLNQVNKICISKPANCIAIDNNGGCSQCAQGFFPFNMSCLKVISRCQSYWNLTTCAKCSAGYELNNQVCQQRIRNCQQMDFNTLRCLSCISGYSPVNNAKLCVQALPNCIVYNNDETCQTCTPGLQLINRRCERIVANCMRYAGLSRICIECRPPLTITNGFCQLSTVNCSSYVDGYCVRCDSGFYLVNSQCQANPSSCQNFNASSQVCLQCIFGFILRLGVCVATNSVDMRGCEVRISPVECQKCLPGFRIRTQDKVCIARICRQYNESTGTCLSCPPRFTLSNDICMSSNCLRPNQDYTCAVCLAGYTIATMDLGNTYCEASNCFRFDENRTCIQCNPWYTVNQQRTCSVANCNLNSSNGSCSQCIQGYGTSSRGVCYVLNCQNIDQPICTSCNLGFFLERGLCVRDPRCSNFINSRCDRCRAGYLTDESGVCQLANCQRATSQLACAVCSSGFSLRGSVCQSNLCIAANEFGCSTCQAGYKPENQSCVVANCANFNNRQNCIRCQARYMLVGGLCYASNCSTFADGSADCKICNPRFQVFEGRCRPRNCSVFNEVTQNCTLCATGFQLKGGVCLFQNCRQSRNNLACTLCHIGFTATPDGCMRTCQVRIFNQNTLSRVCRRCAQGMLLNSDLNGCYQNFCESVNDRNVCSICQVGYQLDPLKVYCGAPDRCRLRNNRRTCLACRPGYRLTEQGDCVVRNCQVADSWQTCIQCNPGYVLLNSTCRPISCQSFDLELNCIRCSDGFALRANGRCEMINCAESINGQCLQCNPTYVLRADGRCVFTGCASNTGDLTCQNCAFKYKLWNGICIPQNCTLVDRGKCVQCEKPLIIQNGFCFQQLLTVPNCIAYSQTTFTCIQCAFGFNLDDIFCKPAGCRTFNGTCVQCQEGFILTAGISICLAKNCASYNRDSLCTQCEENYYLGNQGKCIYIQPLQCSLGEYLNKDIRTCFKIDIPFCLALDLVSRNCTRCIQGISLYQGLCINTQNCALYNIQGCSQCNPGFYLDPSGNCIKSKVGNCNTSNSTGSCLKCLAGYYLQQIRNDSTSILAQQSCKMWKTNCVQFNELQCLSCQSGYSLANGLCRLLPPNCLKLNNQSRCLTCHPGFYNLYGSCVNIINNCQYYNKSEQDYVSCAMCIAGWITANGRCQRIIRGCLVYKPDGNCSACNSSGFTLFTDGNISSCTNVVPDCVRYGLQGCAQCQRGFNLISNQCISKISFCQRHIDENRCSQCKLGFMLSNVGTCGQLIQGCLTLRNDLLCFLCQIGYELAGGICRRTQQRGGSASSTQQLKIQQ